MSVYEVHLARGRRKPEDNDRPLTYREAATQLADYAVEIGLHAHIEVMPLAEHPFDGSWGYQVTGFYAPTHRFGTPEDFAWFVRSPARARARRDSRLGAGAFPRDRVLRWRSSMARTSTSNADPRQGAHMDLGHVIFNYGRNEVRCFSPPTPSRGASVITSTACASMRWRRCSTSITRARGPVDPEQIRRPRKSRGDRVSEARQRSRCTTTIPASG